MKHIAFIVDGNRRWARERNLPTLEGHKRGLEVVGDVIEQLSKKPDLEFASFYLFSTENWSRSADEVSYLMELAKKRIPKLAAKMAKNNIKCVILGTSERVSPDLLKVLREAEKTTANCTGLTACLCFNYGGQQEIADAATACIAAGLTKITPADLAAHLYHPEVPPCDLIVRTSGEQRLSGYHLWRASYSEFIFLDTYWPALTPEIVDSCFEEYASRGRRFGK